MIVHSVETCSLSIVVHVAASSPKEEFSWIEKEGSSPSERLWLLSGPLDGHQGPALKRLFRKDFPKNGARLRLDLTGVEKLDGVGAATLVSLWRRGRERGVEVRIENLSPELRSMLEMVHVQLELPEAPRSAGAFEGIGERTYQAREALLEFLVLASDVTIQSLLGIVRPWKLRWGALLEQSILMGSQALGIVGLITFLVGLTLAFQSAYQLQQFGAAIYVATLTAISMVREMGPLITAILVAGRSGSSITSEVATMKVNEEIDAMQVMGIPFVDFVAVPKLLALVLMVPLLTIIADVLGIMGGWIVGVGYLDLSSGPYLTETLNSLGPKDLGTGLIKSLAFAWGIALIGLHHGTRVRGGAQEVGRATTASVVSAIFFIIVADSIFSILFYVVL